MKRIYCLSLLIHHQQFIRVYEMSNDGNLENCIYSTITVTSNKIIKFGGGLGEIENL